MEIISFFPLQYRIIDSLLIFFLFFLPPPPPPLFGGGVGPWGAELVKILVLFFKLLKHLNTVVYCSAVGSITVLTVGEGGKVSGSLHQGS